MNRMTILYISIALTVIGLSLGLGLGLGLDLGLKKEEDKKSDNDKLNILYINLDKRKDRNNMILNELKDFNNNPIRLNATYNEKGYLGCAMSHIRSLEHAIENNLNNILIFEDDFKFARNKQTVYDEINNFIDETKDWDVLLLAGNNDRRERYNDYIDRIKNSQTTSAYLVNKHYYNTLLDNFKIAYQNLEATDNIFIYSIDQYWKKLQETDNWFALKQFAGIQIKSYSDISHEVVDYRV